MKKIPILGKNVEIKNPDPLPAIDYKEAIIGHLFVNILFLLGYASPIILLFIAAIIFG